MRYVFYRFTPDGLELKEIVKIHLEDDKAAFDYIEERNWEKGDIKAYRNNSLADNRIDLGKETDEATH